MNPLHQASREAIVDWHDWQHDMVMRMIDSLCFTAAAASAVAAVDTDSD